MITHARVPYVDIAQLGEHLPYKQRVVGSSPAIHTRRPIGEWRNLVAHLVWDQGVAGSNPVSPTIFFVFNIIHWAVVKW